MAILKKTEVFIPNERLEKAKEKMKKDIKERLYAEVPPQIHKKIRIYLAMKELGYREWLIKTIEDLPIPQ